MKTHLGATILLSLSLLGVGPVFAQGDATGASDPQAIWMALAKPAFDPAKSASVTKLELDRGSRRRSGCSG